MFQEPDVPLFFTIMATLSPFLFFGVIGLAIVIMVKNYNKAKSMGKDPFTLETEVMAKIADSKLLESELTLEVKLGKADELLAKGTISQSEYAELRKNILKEFGN